MNYPSDEFFNDNVVYRRFPKLFDLSRNVFEFSNALQDKVEPWAKDGSVVADLRDVVSRIYPSSLKTFRSILYLCNEGHGEDAVSLARVVFENYLTVKYIRQSPKDRVYRFKNYPVLETKFMLDAARSQHSKMLPWLRKMLLQEEKRISENYQKVEGLYVGPKENKEKALGNFRRGKWAGIPISKMAEDVSLKGEYDIIFRLHSYFVHTHTFGLEHFCLESGTEVSYGAEPGPHFVLLALPIAGRYLLFTLIEWADVLGLMVDQQKINSFQRKITELETQYLEGGDSW